MGATRAGSRARRRRGAVRAPAAIAAVLALAGVPRLAAAQERFFAQTFTAPADPGTSLRSLSTTGVTGSGPSTFEIFAWGGAGVTGPALFTATVPGGAPFAAVAFAPHLSLGAGQTYAFVFAQNDNGLSSFGFTAGDLYPTGAAYECVPSRGACALLNPTAEFDLAGFTARFSAVPEPGPARRDGRPAQRGDEPRSRVPQRPGRGFAPVAAGAALDHAAGDAAFTHGRQRRPTHAPR
jgi:hypothetical protein